MLSAWGNHPSHDSFRLVSPLCQSEQAPIATCQFTIYQSISHAGHIWCTLVHAITCKVH